MKNPESYVINGGKTTPYFKLKRGTRQGHPISEYLFIIALKYSKCKLENEIFFF